MVRRPLTPCRLAAPQPQLGGIPLREHGLGAALRLARRLRV